MNKDERFLAVGDSAPYPFTTSGKIFCVYHPSFSCEVYFLPEGYTNESYIDTALNKSAVNSLNKNNMSTNVPYSVKKGADLSDTIQVGLRVHEE